MGFGFEAYNDNGDLVASTEAPMYHVYGSGVVDMSDAALVSNAFAPYYQKALVNSVDDINDFIAVAPTNGYGGCTGTYEYPSGTFNTVFVSNSQATDIPFLKLTKDPAASGNAGLRLWDASGNLLVNSDKRIMTLNNVHTFSAGWSFGASAAETGVQNRYVIFGNVVYEFAIGQTGLPNTYQTFKPMVKLETNLLRVSGSGYLNRTGGGAAAGQQQLVVLTADF